MKLWFFLVILVHSNMLQSKKLQSHMISWREGVVACLDSNNYPILSLVTKNMEPPLLWPKNGQILIFFLTDPIPVVSKWLGKIKTLILGLYTGSEILTLLNLLAKLLNLPGISQRVLIILWSLLDWVTLNLGPPLPKLKYWQILNFFAHASNAMFEWPEKILSSTLGLHWA